MNNRIFSPKAPLGTALTLSALLVWAPAFAAPKVVASIAPIHSLVSMVMEGVGEPDLLVEANLSPHDFSMKPSHARILENADIVFWVGPALEAFLQKPIESLSGGDVSVELIETDGLRLLGFRDAETMGKEHSHEENAQGEEHENAEEHAHEEEHDHAAEEGHDDDHIHEHEAGHQHEGHVHTGEFDPHIWLDPHNAAVMVKAIAANLGKLDPENAEVYSSNAEIAARDLSALTDKISERLSGAGENSFIAFHDGTQYFETRFGLTAKGLLLDNPEVSASAARMTALRDILQEENVSCIFSEVQFSTDVVDNLIDGLDVKIEMLDPLGADIAQGSGLYEALLTNLTTSFERCLS